MGMLWPICPLVVLTTKNSHPSRSPKGLRTNASAETVSTDRSLNGWSLAEPTLRVTPQLQPSSSWRRYAPPACTSQNWPGNLVLSVGSSALVRTSSRRAAPLAYQPPDSEVETG